MTRAAAGVLLLAAAAVAANAIPMAVPVAGAQAPASAPGSAPVDSVLLARATALLQGGNGAAARALADSLVRGRREGTPGYAEALFLRATVAADGADAERDYLRIVVAYPLSPRAEEALLRLAQVALARGDRGTARRHLERLAREHPTGESAGARAFWLGRILLEDGDLKGACVQLAEAQLRLAAGDVEGRNQLAYYLRQCASLVTPPSDERESPPPRREGSRAEGSRSEGSRGASQRGRWSVQVAAFTEREDAERLARKLSNGGYDDVRVTASAPWRVRIGQFRDRDDAVALVRRLKARQTEAIVVEAER